MKTGRTEKNSAKNLPEIFEFKYGRYFISSEIIYTNRKTLEIAVHPDGHVTARAPVGTPVKKIEDKLKKRAGWIILQKNFFSQYTPRTPERRYLSGETHLYLGRRYRLKIEKGIEGGVKLSRGILLVKTDKSDKVTSSEMIKEILYKWYLEKAIHYFEESLIRCWERMRKTGIKRPKIQIRRMSKRWGSLSPGGTMTLNIELIKAPRECIDYVITHELCHLNNRDHNTKFYRMLSNAIPEWEKVKHKLELMLI